MEVWQLLAESHTTKDIAGILGVSAKTVQDHRTKLIKKLNLEKYNSALLTRVAVELGVIEL